MTDSIYSTDPDSPRVRQMLEGYDCHDFGAGECLGREEILMYVRRPKTLCRDDGDLEEMESEDSRGSF